MKKINKLILGSSLALLIGSTAFAQFDNKLTLGVGQGEELRAYAITLPPQVTVKMPDGSVIGPGEKIMVPGKNITVVEVEDETHAAYENTDQEVTAFNKEVTYTEKPEGLGVVALLIEITKPGVVVSHEDGRTATTGDTIQFLMLHGSIQQTPELEAPPEMTGFENK
jgi:hypothetical protein